MPDQPTVAEVLALLGERAPWSKAAGWDKGGLEIGDPAAPVASAAVCHEVSDEVVAAAERENLGLLITYHPLLFHPISSLVPGPSAEGRAWRLARAGIAVAVAHTSFDVARGGCADALADELGLTALQGFGPLWSADSVKIVTFAPGDEADAVAAAMAAAGAGEIGNYTACSFRAEGVGVFLPGPGASPTVGDAGELHHEREVRIEMNAPRSRRDAVVAALVAAHPYEEPAYDVYERRGDAGFVGRVGDASAAPTIDDLARLVRERLGGPIRAAGAPDRPPGRVAVVPGSGSDLIEAAAAAGAGTIVTGDISHHRARAALDAGLGVIDPGHTASERPGVARLYAAVADIVDGAIDLTEMDPGPWWEGD